MASIAVFIHATLANENWSFNYKRLANDSSNDIKLPTLPVHVHVYVLEKLHVETILKVGVHQIKLNHMQLHVKGISKFLSRSNIIYRPLVSPKERQPNLFEYVIIF